MKRKLDSRSHEPQPKKLFIFRETENPAIPLQKLLTPMEVEKRSKKPAVQSQNNEWDPLRANEWLRLQAFPSLYSQKLKCLQDKLKEFRVMPEADFLALFLDPNNSLGPHNSIGSSKKLIRNLVTTNSVLVDTLQCVKNPYRYTFFWKLSVNNNVSNILHADVDVPWMTAVAGTREEQNAICEVIPNERGEVPRKLHENIFSAVHPESFLSTMFSNKSSPHFFNDSVADVPIQHVINKLRME